MTETGLHAALAAAQGEFPPIEKSKTVTVTTKTGRSYTFAYAPLDSILGTVRPVLAKHGLAVTQLLTARDDGQPALETRILHSSGEQMGGVFPLPAAVAMMTAQEIGSLLTYLRRYALVALLGIATEEDDDGNHAAGNTATRKKKPAAKPAGATNGGAVISRDEAVRLFAIAGENDVTNDRLKEIMTEIAGVDSTKQLQRDKYGAVVAAVEAEGFPF